MDVLRAFTGNDELAVQAKNAEQLRELIKLLAVTSSQIGSRSLALVDNSSRQQPGEEVVAMAKQQVLVETRDLVLRKIFWERPWIWMRWILMKDGKPEAEPGETGFPPGKLTTNEGW